MLAGRPAGRPAGRQALSGNLKKAEHTARAFVTRRGTASINGRRIGQNTIKKTTDPSLGRHLSAKALWTTIATPVVYNVVISSESSSITFTHVKRYGYSTGNGY